MTIGGSGGTRHRRVSSLECVDDDDDDDADDEVMLNVLRCRLTY